MDNDGLVRVDSRFVAPLQTLHASVFASHPILANLASLATGKPEGAYPSMAGQDRTFHLFQETDRPANSIAGVPFAAPARAGPDVEIFEHDRVAEFENLGICQPGVGHMRVDRIGAIKSRARGRTGADRFVILIAGVAEIEIVHGALGRGKRPERAEKAVGHRLGGFDISGNDGSGKFR